MRGGVVRWLGRGIAFALLFGFLAAVVLRYGFFPPMPGHPDMAHAGGLPGGVRYTNAIAALEESRSLGFTVFEIDILATSDGRLVCGHDWNELAGLAPDFDGFLAWRQTLEYEPCTVEELLDWFDGQGDAILYSDVKELPLIAHEKLHARLGDRLIADASTPEMICDLAELGIRKIVFSTYRRPVSYERLRADLVHPCLVAHEPFAVAVPVLRMLAGHGFVARALTGRPVFVHTVDGCLQGRVMRLLGADALFSEGLRPGQC